MERFIATRDAKRTIFPASLKGAVHQEMLMMIHDLFGIDGISKLSFRSCLSRTSNLHD